MKRLFQLAFIAAVLLTFTTGCAHRNNLDAEVAKEPAKAPVITHVPGVAAAPAPEEPKIRIESEETVELHAPPPQDDSPLTPQEEQALETETEFQFDLDNAENRELRLYFKYFTHNRKGRRHFEIWLERSEKYFPYIRKVLKERGLPGDLAYLPFVESGYNPKAKSRAGAAGLWQFMPFTGKKFGLERGWWIDERLDPFKATHAAADYLTFLHQEFGDWYLALAAYNAGEGRVGRALKSTGCDDFFDLATKSRYVRRYGRNIHYLPRETRHYVPKFLAVLKIVRNLESLGFKRPNWSDSNLVVEVKVPPKTDLKAMAAALQMDWDDFRALNPAFWEPASHPERESNIYIPAKKSMLAANYLQGDVKQYTSYYTYYRVRKGDSWYKIGRRCGIPYGVLKAYNNRSSNILRPGESIKIPGRGEARKTASSMRSGRASTSVTDSKTRDLAKKRSNYTVRNGDSLWLVAKRHGVKMTTLAKANGLSSRARLKIGQKLYIPDLSHSDSKKSLARAEQTKETIAYRVRRGDTLYSIAKRFGVSYKSLMAWNHMRTSRIYPGDTIKVHLR
jgi:membrane-bound lytic murein transglycosylase D